VVNLLSKGGYLIYIELNLYMMANVENGNLR